MTTRRAAAKQPIAFEKYMSSPEYAELRGIDGIAATAKGSMLEDPAKRSLLFFLQAMSLRPGGLVQLASELIDAFPERLGTAQMRSKGVKKGLIYSEKAAQQILIQLKALELDLDLEEWEAISKEQCSGEYLLSVCRQRAIEAMPRLLTEICINPRCEIATPRDSALEEIKAEYFEGIIAALFDYQRIFWERAGAGLAQTEVAAQITKTLDRALAHRKMIVLEGEPGIGKTKAAQTWCEMHLGQARFVSLSGCVNKTSIFRMIGRALGIASGYMRGATEMQARVEDVLQRSRLMLVIDEGHFLFGQGERIYSRPEMIDWIDTALCNQGVPVALVATPQFTRRLLQAEKQTIWQSTQFRRRVKDYVRLPMAVSETDIEAVARKIFPDCDRASIKLAVGYALLSRWPLSWLANLAEDAGAQAKEAGREKVEFADLDAAIKLFRTPSDLAQATAFNESAKPRGQRRPGRLAVMATAPTLPDDSAPESDMPGLSARNTRPQIEMDHPRLKGLAPA